MNTLYIIKQNFSAIFEIASFIKNFLLIKQEIINQNSFSRFLI